MKKWIYGILTAAIFAIAGCGNVNSPVSETNTTTEQETVSKETPEKEGIVGIEVKDSESDEASDFKYDIEGEEIILHSYSGRDSILEIKTQYTVDGKEYKTNIEDFQVWSSKVKTLIIDEGFETVKTPIFNSCGVENVYFPKSMTNVYDYTLAYLHPDEGQRIKIYYGGTQEEWLDIFTQYKRTKVEDAKGGSEVGQSLADKINEIVGTEYDSSLFEYFFSANPEDLK